MNRPPCATSRCHGRLHKPDCEGDCRGCLPRPAADGAYLCLVHSAWLEQDALEAARLHGELEQRMVGGNAGGDKVRTELGSKYPDQRAIDARQEIRHTLASWCRLIAEERGVGLPLDQVSAMGEFVALHGSWLAAQPFAAEVSDELHELAHGKPRSVAYPSGSKVVEVGPCPRECAGTLRAIVRPGDALLPSEVVCDADLEHRWAASEWRQLDRLVSARRVA